MAAAVEKPHTTGRIGMFGGTSDGKPAVMDYANKEGSNMNQPAQIDIKVEDVRYSDPKPSFANNGYEYVRHPTGVTPEQLSDYASEEGDKIVREIYAPECKKLVEQITGANVVIPFHWHTRTQGSATGNLLAASARLGGVLVAHMDRDDVSGLHRLKGNIGEEETDRLVRTHRRWGHVNVWRPLSTPVRVWPLCMVNHENIPDWSYEKNMARLHVKNTPDKAARSHDTLLVDHPDYRYHYVSNQEFDDCWLFSACDSDASKATPHGAFWDNSSNPDCPPRHSFELRCWVFFDPIEGAE